MVAGVYVQAISAFAPHPNAAKLWMEYLYSDEGQLGWLKGYCHPIRFNDLVAQRQGPAGAARQAAAGGSLRGGGLPDAREQEAANRRSSPSGWDATVGANVAVELIAQRRGAPDSAPATAIAMYR